MKRKRELVEGAPRRRRSQSPAESFARRLEALHVALAPQLPDVDPDDLTLILHSILRPLGSGRRFILRRAGSGLVI